MTDILWFTSTMSVDMHGQNRRPTFGGLYKCKLEQETGTCDEPELVVDSWDHDGNHHRGLDLMNVSDETIFNRH
jgi:hypothetical protein